MLMAFMLAGCGGGGGGSTESGSGPTEQPQGDDGASSGPAIALNEDSFYFAPNASLQVAGALDKVAGGTSLLAAWNPNNGDADKVLSPGMKVMFFGMAQDCLSGSQGPVDASSEARLSELAALTGMPSAAATATLRWVPSADTEACDAAVRSKRGASGVFVNASPSDGAVAMLTSSGVQPDGARSFFGPYSSLGQNGSGDNAYITGTFVNFRHAAWKEDPLQPWTGGAKARLRSEQRIVTARVEGSTASTVQVKQQMMATFYNNQCRKDKSTNPCQIQYLMDTAIVRAGVSDWSTQSWFANAKVWFDPVQGGIPIVSGPIFGSGVTTADSERGLGIWSSQGSASQHAAFALRTFDVTISFEQLLNVVRITTGRFANKLPGAVTDAEIAAVWGTAWQDPNAWSLLSADVGQEVYNPAEGFRAEIGGGFKSLYVGPQ